MSEVVRYFHIRNHQLDVGSRYNAATVRVVGDTERVGQVDVQVAYCSLEDQFERAKGRNVASGKPVKVVPLYNLAKELAKIDSKVFGVKCPNDFYLFGLRYFLPKE